MPSRTAVRPGPSLGKIKICRSEASAVAAKRPRPSPNERRTNRCPELTSKGHTDLRSCVSEAKFVKESDFDVKTRLAPPKSTENNEKRLSDTEKIRRFCFFASTNVFGVENSKVANRLKRVLTKFEADRSHVRGVNGRSKFVVAASAGRAERKNYGASITSFPSIRRI